MTDWSKCPVVESVPGRVSGATGCSRTRVCRCTSSLRTLRRRATIYDFIDWFGGVDEPEVRAVLEHVAQELRAKVVHAGSCSITGLPGSFGVGLFGHEVEEPSSAIR